MKVGRMVRIALPIILGCVMAGGVAAQEALPETPPELRDFRLDPQSPPQQPEPLPEVQTPPAARAVEPEPQPTATREDRPETVRARPVPSPATDSNQAIPTSEIVQATPEPPAEPLAERPSPLAEGSSPLVETPTPATPSTMPWWQIANVLAAAMAVLAGWLFWRNRRARSVEPVDLDLPAVQEFAPSSPVFPKPELTLPVTTLARRPQISLEFIPERATLGFSALTLKGQLRLINNGDASASDMQLRATMISANQRQSETIAAFHGGAIPIAPNPLGEAKAGERLSLDIELSVQVNEIDSYNVGEKKIFVPVMLANLAYSWEGGTDNVTIACMIGRETKPPQPKMGPLRLDLGPRSFSPLGQRPIYA